MIDSSLQLPVDIRLMRQEDLDFAHSLRETVGWNQTREDWQRFIGASPTGVFVAERSRTPVGTATTICYGRSLAWIGMVLVSPEARGSGIGKALLHHCLSYLRTNGVSCIKLDATPAGRPLYEKLGFRPEWGLSRWEGEPDAKRLPKQPDFPLLPLDPAGLEQIDTLDRRAFGISRRLLFPDLLKDSERAVVIPSPDRGSPVQGYGFLRRGSRAFYLGPAACSSPETGLAVVSSLLACVCGRKVFWDIPDAQTEAIAFAQSLGFKRQRSLMRMFLGQNSSPGDPRLQLALVDPAAG